MTAEQLLLLMTATETEANARTKVTMRTSTSLHAYIPTCLDNLVVECLAPPFVIGGMSLVITCRDVTKGTVYVYTGACTQDCHSPGL